MFLRGAGKKPFSSCSRPRQEGDMLIHWNVENKTRVALLFLFNSIEVC